MSKFSEKLTRLHSSRVRALETDEDGTEKRVFLAEPESEPAPEPEPPLEPELDRDTPARKAVRQQLEIGERLGGRATARRPRMSGANSSPPPSRRGFAAPDAGTNTAIGERLSELRRQADALIKVGSLEPALPMLHEMVALSSTHPWALKHLAAYWKSRGETTLATYYEDRLAAVAPY